MTAPITIDGGPGASSSGATASFPAEGTSLTLLYDERCTFCLRCRDWLAHQGVLVPVELLPAGSVDARERFGILPWLGQELVIVDGRGRTWIGPAAYLVAMWATRRYRAWAYVLSRPGMAKHAERFFWWVSGRRATWSRWLHPEDDCTYCQDIRMRRAP